MEKYPIGMKKKANNGQMMEIIARINKNDITVRFEDGTIVHHKTSKSFGAGEIGNPNIHAIKAKREGQEAYDRLGNHMVLVEYMDSEHCRIRYDDGLEISGKKYWEFCDPNHVFHERISFDAKRRKEAKQQAKQDKKPYAYIGKKIIAKNGQTAEIIALHNNDRCDVRFDDGTIVKNKHIATFMTRKIMNPNRMTEEQKRMLGDHNKYEVPFLCSNGLRARIIRYGNRRDVDIQFEDGEIAEHLRMDHIKRGNVSHPILKMYGFPYKYHGYEIRQRAFKLDGVQYYHVTKPNGMKDIMPPAQILIDIKTPLAF